MSYGYKRLRGRIVEKFGTQDKFAEALGTSRQVVSRKMQSKTQFSQADIEQWCKLLDIELSEIGEFFYA